MLEGLIVRSSALLAALAIAAAPAVGCGGNEDSASGSESLTRAMFVRQANALCRKERVGLGREAAKVFRRELSRGFPHDVALHEVAHYVLLPAIEEEISKIRRLRIPPVDRPGVEAALSAERVALDSLASASRLSSMKDFHQAFAESGLEFRVNGLDDCANDR
jgi:hypothetical protein